MCIRDSADATDASVADYDDFYIGFYPTATNSNFYLDHVSLTKVKDVYKRQILQQYTRVPYRNKETISIFISESFNGDYSTIKEEDWQCLSGANGQLPLKVPLCRCV